MRIAIGNILVKKRIRKEIGDISAFAEDIKANGLISPIAVMPCGDGYQLLAGLRRLKAVTSLGHTDIEANVFEPKDAENALYIEISENEQRKPFTFSEQMYYGRIIEEIEKAKSEERMKAGVKISGDDPTAKRPEGSTRAERETRYIVGGKIGMVGRQYDRAKYIADNAPPEIIEQLDRGERTIRSVYDAMRGITKKPLIGAPSAKQPDSSPKPAPPSPAPEPKPRPRPADYERLQADYDALKAKSDDMLGKYVVADNKREMLEIQLKNTHLQWDCERQGKDGSIAALRTELTAARARIEELEAELAEAEAKITKLEACHVSD